MLERVAVIGLGNMGLPIARNLLRAGFPLTVHNRTKAKAEPLVAEGAAWAESPAAAGARAREDPSWENLVKIAGNFLLVAMLEALGEVFAFVEKAGMNRLEVLETLNGALFASPIYQANGERMCRGAFSPAGFQLALGLKDARLVLRAADQLGVPMPLAGLAHDHLLTGVARGQGHLDWTAVAEVLRDAAGVGSR